jgi:hypothetical protein
MIPAPRWEFPSRLIRVPYSKSAALRNVMIVVKDTFVKDIEFEILQFMLNQMLNRSS